MFVEYSTDAMTGITGVFERFATRSKYKVTPMGVHINHVNLSGTGQEKVEVHREMVLHIVIPHYLMYFFVIKISTRIRRYLVTSQKVRDA